MFSVFRAAQSHNCAEMLANKNSRNFLNVKDTFLQRMQEIIVVGAVAGVPARRYAAAARIQSVIAK